MYCIYVGLVPKKYYLKFLRAFCHSAVHGRVHDSLTQFCGHMSRNTLWVDFTSGHLTGYPLPVTAPTAGQTQKV